MSGTANVCALARKRMVDYVRSLQTTNAVVKATTAIKAGFVGSIVTPMKGLAGNAAWGSLRTLVTQPATAGVDYLQALGRSIADGKLTLHPNEYREVVNNLNFAGLKAYGRGLKRGLDIPRAGLKSGLERARALPPGTPFGKKLATVVDEIRLHLDQNSAAQMLEHTPVKYDNPYAQAFVDGSFAAAEIADRPFYMAALDASVAMQGKLYAMREGLKGNALKARQAWYQANPTDEMMLRATQDAQYATYKDKGVLAAGASKLKSFLKEISDAEADSELPSAERAAKVKRAAGRAGLYITETTVPFTGVPSSMVAKMAAMSPLGLVSPRMVGGQALRSEALVQALMGTGGIALGYQWAKDGLITGAAPLAPAARADWDAAGLQPFSLKVPGVGNVDLKSLGPVVSPLFIGAALASAREQNPDQSVVGAAGTVAGATGKLLLEQSYMQNVKGMIDAANDSENRGESLAASQVPAPALLAQMARALDPKEREARTFGDKMKAKVPFLSRTLPEKMGSLGTLPEKSTAERVSSVVSPFRVNRDSDTPELKELRRLGVTLGLPQRTVRFGRKSVSIPKDDYRAMVEERGARALEEIRFVMNEKDYAEQTHDEQRRRVEYALNRVKNSARKPVRASLSESK